MFCSLSGSWRERWLHHRTRVGYGSKTIVIPVFFSGVLIMISGFFHGHQIVEYIQTSLVNRVLVGETSENRMGDTYHPWQLKLGNTHVEEKRMESVFVLLPKLVFFGFSAIWHLNEELALMVLSCLSPCSHLELSIGDHGGSGFAMKLLVAWKTWCNTWVSSVNIYCRPWWF